MPENAAIAGFSMSRNGLSYLKGASSHYRAILPFRMLSQLVVTPILVTEIHP